MAKQIKKYGKKALILGLILVLVAMYGLIPLAEAANEIDNREMKISDSRLSQASVTYDFEGDHTATNVTCLEIEFCQTASGSCTVPSAMDASGATKGTEGDWNVWTYADWSIGTSLSTSKVYYFHATSEGSALGLTDRSFTFNGIDNSDTNGVYFARVKTYDAGTTAGCTGTVIDEGVATFYTISGVTVQVTVAETLVFTITGRTAAQCGDIADSSTEIDTSATSVPFGTTGGDEFIDGCQMITIGTNAPTGYGTTVQELDQLKDGSANTITSVNSGDGECDGGGEACTETAAAQWATDTNNGFAYCMDDSQGTGNAAETAGWDAAEECVDATPEFQVFPENDTDTPDTEVIMSSATNVTANDISYIGYRLSADPLSVAGAYSNTLVFVTTPIY